MIKVNVLGSSSKGNAYVVDDGETKLLLECGITWKEIRKKMDFKTSEIAACLISHRHSDHCKAINDVAKAGIDIYLAEEERKAIGIEHHRAKPIKPMEQFKIGTWTILPFDVQHDTENPLGFLLANKNGEKLLFVTDTYYVKYRFRNVNVFMVEVNYSLPILDANIETGRVHKGMRSRLLKSHFSLENAIEFFKANDLSKVQEIHLLHLSDTNSDEELFKEEIQKVAGKPVYVC